MKFEDAMLIDVRVGEENPRRLKMLALKYQVSHQLTAPVSESPCLIVESMTLIT